MLAAERQNVYNSLGSKPSDGKGYRNGEERKINSACQEWAHVDRNVEDFGGREMHRASAGPSQQ